eukprot:2007955-Amphidinium_carterae.2
MNVPLLLGAADVDMKDWQGDSGIILATTNRQIEQVMGALKEVNAWTLDQKKHRSNRHANLATASD